MRSCLVIYWLSLALWLGALVAGGIAAINVFGRLPALDMTLDRFAAYPVDEHGRIAAGLVMSGVFFTADVVQFAVVPLALVTVVLQVTLLGLPVAKPSNLIRLGCVVVGAGLFAYYALAVAPPLNASLVQFHEAAEAGNLDLSARHAGTLAGYHHTAELILQGNLLLVLTAIGASAVAHQAAGAISALPRETLWRGGPKPGACRK